MILFLVSQLFFRFDARAVERIWRSTDEKKKNKREKKDILRKKNSQSGMNWIESIGPYIIKSLSVCDDKRKKKRKDMSCRCASFRSWNETHSWNDSHNVPIAAIDISP